MKVELSIRDDRELRAHVKECIRGEVTAIARSEIVNILKDVLGSRLGQQPFEDLLTKTIEEAVTKAIDHGEWGKRSIRQMVLDEVQKRMDDFFKFPHIKT